MTDSRAAFDDIDHADVIGLFGHNIAETQPVQWRRCSTGWRAATRPTWSVRRPAPHGSRPPRDRAHPARVGTNLAFMNAVLREVIANDWVDRDYVAQHAVGFEELRQPGRAVHAPRGRPRSAASRRPDPRGRRCSASARRLLCTVLQGVYQSHQATASAFRSTTW